MFDTENLLNSSISNEKYHLLKKGKINFPKKVEEINNKKYHKSSENKINDKGISNERSFNKILNHSNLKDKTKSNNDFSIGDIESFNISQKITLPFKKNNISKRENVIKNITKTFDNFWKFILFKLSIGKKKKTFEFYHKFRVKLLSEEHLIKNHLTMCNLVKDYEKRRHRTIKYHLSDLLKHF